MFWKDSRGREWEFMCQHSWIDEGALQMIVENMDEWKILYTWWDWDVRYDAFRTYCQRKVFCTFDFLGEKVCMETIISEHRVSSE